MFQICSKLTIKTPERCHWPRSGVFIVNFEKILLLNSENEFRLGKFRSAILQNSFLSVIIKGRAMQIIY